MYKNTCVFIKRAVKFLGTSLEKSKGTRKYITDTISGGSKRGRDHKNIITYSLVHQPQH